MIWFDFENGRVGMISSSKTGKKLVSHARYHIISRNITRRILKCKRFSLFFIISARDLAASPTPPCPPWRLVFSSSLMNSSGPVEPPRFFRAQRKTRTPEMVPTSAKKYADNCQRDSGHWTLSSLMFTLETLSGNLTWTPFCLSCAPVRTWPASMRGSVSVFSSVSL